MCCECFSSSFPQLCFLASVSPFFQGAFFLPLAVAGGGGGDLYLHRALFEKEKRGRREKKRIDWHVCLGYTTLSFFHGGI